MRRKFSEEQINILKQYYPTGDWDNILPFFPSMKIVNIRALARRYGVKQDKKNYRNCSEPLAYCRTISAFPANAAVNAS